MSRQGFPIKYLVLVEHFHLLQLSVTSGLDQAIILLISHVPELHRQQSWPSAFPS
jgi:hypothetical protein